MPKYAVTAVFYVESVDEDHARTIVDQMVREDYLYKDKDESWGIVEVSEVEF
jgi:hypothetical protein